MGESVEILFLAVLLMCFGREVKSDAFNHRYKAGDQVPFYANKVGPYRNPIMALTIILGLAGVFYPYNRGYLMTALVLIYASTSGVWYTSGNISYMDISGPLAIPMLYRLHLSSDCYCSCNCGFDIYSTCGRKS